MRASILLRKIALAALSFLVITVLYSFIWYKESFDRPVWIQVVMIFCFLMLSINNFKLKKYMMAWLFAGITLAFSISIYWNVTAV
ncbi:hypothetical protein CSE16_13565 [Solibacillus sp. R5-41]|uniref:hypothetical protein n=1 Tax=Solibacillus sp. R5-41 TaxID=2048654 RepID=UPI000C1271BC|nr:hypothetical protein [Solibacillus sp. R5-41]ATP40998.1 hypothetical protein CSE16_13565 [Solibacillus sp. R5-41]